MEHLQLDQKDRQPLLRRQGHHHDELPPPASSKSGSQAANASLRFIGTATTILEWQGFRIMTDPNFLHAGDHVHLGPGVTATRQTNPAIELDALPPLDCILLSHYHADHFDQHVEEELNRAFPIITTPHAKSCLSSKQEPFTGVHQLDVFESIMLHNDQATIKITGTPGKHVPPGMLSRANDLLGAVPPTNGWIIELGQSTGDELKTGYRIYITGDTLFVDDLKKIPEWLDGKQVDLMLCHLGGTTIPGPSLPVLMVTMDAKQGVQMIHLINPDVTVPIHFDDYDVFLSPLDDFKKEVTQAGLGERVVYLDRGEEYRFQVEDRK